MYAELKMAIEAAKTAYDIAKAANDLQRHGELLGAVTAVQDQLQAALLANLSLLERQSELQARLTIAEEAARKTASVEDLRRQYVLKEVYRGVVLEPLVRPANGEATRYLCVTCMDKGIATTLQPLGGAFHCQPCNATILRAKPAQKVRRTQSSPYLRSW